MKQKTNKIISLDIAEISFREALEAIMMMGKNRIPSFSCFANVHMVIEGYFNKAFSEQVNQSRFVFADGKPIALACGILHKTKQERIAGMDFTPSLLSESNKENMSVFFFGSTTQILNKICEKIKQTYPNVRIAGAISPPFGSSNKEETSKYIKQINESNTNFVFVALGCPKQEKWMFENYKNINAHLLGVGGALPVFAGIQSRAPEWMQRFALEWLYRLIKEPKRLWKRYLITNSYFIYLLVKYKWFCQ